MTTIKDEERNAGFQIWACVNGDRRLARRTSRFILLYLAAGSFRLGRERCLDWKLHAASTVPTVLHCSGTLVSRLRILVDPPLIAAHLRR